MVRLKYIEGTLSLLLLMQYALLFVSQYLMVIVAILC